MFKRLERVGLDGFVVSLIGALLVAYWLPEVGIKEGLFSLQRLSNIGVSLIFFFYGLKLSPKELKSGLYNWPLHLVVQSVTFIIFPLIVLFFWKISGAPSTSLLWIGTFFLATLPSTVSSSVVMVSIANGNLPSAIFNASISSLIGVAVTPLWIGLIIASDGSTSNGLSIDLSDSIIKLSLQVLLPLFLGVLLHSRYGAIALRHKEALKLFDQSVIILIVYISFCESFAHNMFKDSSWWQLVWLSVAMVALFFLIYGVVLLIGRVLKFSREDKITALFCGSKKSLVHGTVMAKVLFPKVAGVGVILLPLMIFHTLQLVIASIIARSFAKKVAAV